MFLDKYVTQLRDDIAATEKALLDHSLPAKVQARFEQELRALLAMYAALNTHIPATSEQKRLVKRLLKRDVASRQDANCIIRQELARRTQRREQQRLGITIIS